MKTEIAVTVCRTFRIVEENFWFQVERRTPRGWKKDFSTRDRHFASFIMEGNFVRSIPERIAEMSRQAETGEDHADIAYLEAIYVRATGEQVPSA